MAPTKHTAPVLPPEGATRAPPANDVIAASRLKFFKRPVVPFLQSVPAEVLLAPNARPAPVVAPEPAADDPAFQPKNRTVSCQTLYREGSTQTDPYTRDYMTAENQPDPEILSIAHLTYGKGLPASLEEVKLIHRMREKAAFEKSLPPMTDAANFELRKKLLEEREMKEWKMREEEMRKDQEDKLQILISTLKTREMKSEALSEARIDAVRQEKLNQRDLSFAQIHKDRIKVHRSLAKTRSKVAQVSGKRDIVEEHANYASRVYAPKAFEGRLAVSNQVVDYGIPLINNYQGLLALESNVPAKMQETEIKVPQNLKKHKNRKSQKISADLEYCDQLLEGAKTKPENVKIENMYRKFEPVTRAAVPFVEPPVNEDPNKAILLLQRLLRGRAVQNSMYKGKEHSLALIRELRVSEEPVPEEKEDPSVAFEAAFDSLRGEVISHVLDFMTKETIRQKEEEHIKVLVEVGKQTRRIREAEETGRRQAADLLRKKTEQQYRELGSETGRAVDQYLTDLFDASIEQVSHETASHEARVKAQYLEKVVTDVEARREHAKVVAEDLVGNWLFGEVDRRREKAAKELSERAYQQTAHSTALDLVATVLNIRTAENPEPEPVVASSTPKQEEEKKE